MRQSTEIEFIRDVGFRVFDVRTLLRVLGLWVFGSSDECHSKMSVSISATTGVAGRVAIGVEGVQDSSEAAAKEALKSRQLSNPITKNAELPNSEQKSRRPQYLI